MTSKTKLGDIRMLSILKLTLEHDPPIERVDDFIKWLENNKSLWEITDNSAFDAKVTELMAEWKAQNMKS